MDYLLCSEDMDGNYRTPNMSPTMSPTMSPDINLNDNEWDGKIVVEDFYNYINDCTSDLNNLSESELLDFYLNNIYNKKAYILLNKLKEQYGKKYLILQNLIKNNLVKKDEVFLIFNKFMYIENYLFHLNMTMTNYIEEEIKNLQF